MTYLTSHPGRTLGLPITALAELVAGWWRPRRASSELDLLSPRIRRAIENQRGGPWTVAASPGDEAQCPALPFAYSVRPHCLNPECASLNSAWDGATATRFSVVAADPPLLAFLARSAPGFHVFELSCAGLETWWRNDLATVLETRRAIAGRMTIFAEDGETVVEHLALPMLEAGRVAAITGWFDPLGVTGSIPAPRWGTVRCVRRFERAQTIVLPAHTMTHPANTITQVIAPITTPVDSRGNVPARAHPAAT